MQRDTRNNALVTWVFDHVDEQETVSRRISYQYLLRALGAWLDAKDACNINLIETSGGFMVRYGIQTSPVMLSKHILTYAELEHLEATMKERRGLHPSGHYQDFLRALGYEIDQQAGSYVLLDEVEEDFFLSLAQPSARGGLLWLKRARILSTNDRSALLRKAYARRKNVEPSKKFWHHARDSERSVQGSRRSV